MTTATIPLDFRNFGQVWSCLGLLELADMLWGAATGHFQWAPHGDTGTFTLQTPAGPPDLMGALLSWLSQASIEEAVLPDLKTPTPLAQTSTDTPTPLSIQQIVVHSVPVPLTQDPKIRPIRLVHQHQTVWISHWGDTASGRDSWKTFSGQKSATQTIADLLTRIRSAWDTMPDRLRHNPFAVTEALPAAFNWDVRKGWTSLDYGYSPNDHNQFIVGSPLVELLTAIALEFARPGSDPHHPHGEYAIWSDSLPPLLARPAIAGIDVGVPRRLFRFWRRKSGKTTILSYAEEVFKHDRNNYGF